MKFRIDNGVFVGTAEWRRAGVVDVDIAEPDERRFLEHYLSTPYSALGGPIDCPEMQYEAPDSSEQAFERAMYRLMEHAYTVRRLDNESAAAWEQSTRRSA
jgi:hypothetical protein